VIRFHLDECINHNVADGLAGRGIDVTTSTETGLTKSSDQSQFASAVSQGRVLVTCDRDFLRIAATNYEHPGIVYAHPIFATIGDIVRYCDDLAFGRDVAELVGRVMYVPSSRSPR
jgi:Domain of unknown function (DUF5615)